jgi:D-xylose transport system ATP-binding protein
VNLSTGDVSQGEPVLRAEEIVKSYGHVRALRGVTIHVSPNEVLGLVGDNGAGKSTLIKILSGNLQPDSGAIHVDGHRIVLHDPSAARALGIETVYQNLALSENLDAVANLFIGRELFRSFLGIRILQEREMERRAKDVLERVGAHIPSVREKVEFLSGGQRQAVALGRFVAWGRKLVLLDEPTAALGVRETHRALELLAEERQRTGISMIFISHNIDHVFRMADRIAVMRHGNVVGVRGKRSTTPDEVVGLITGSVGRDSERDPSTVSNVT